MMTTLTNKPILQHASVSALIPQQPPIEMVDTLWLNDDTTTISGFTIQPDNIFCKNGFFTEPGIIENIAQTAALRAGYTVSLLEKDGKLTGPPPVGYIAAIKNLNIRLLPKVGDDLKTQIIVKQVIFDVTLIAAETTCNGQPVADCEMKIFLKKP